MAKIILFNTKRYAVDSAKLSIATNKITKHLNSSMSGTGAEASFAGIKYDIDATRLASAETKLATCLENLPAGTTKVIVDDTTYQISGIETATAGISSRLVKLSGGGVSTQAVLGQAVLGAMILGKSSTN